jgi:hypothetical protein
MSGTTATVNYGRRAYGHQRRMTPEQKARYVAESIQLRINEGLAWDWQQYGLQDNPEQQQRVRLALAALR